jgi:ABC-type transport system involved in cytochrome c biogenesis permease component
VSFVWTSARKDLARRARDPMSVLLWMGIPVVIGGLMSLVMDFGGGDAPKAHVLFVDQDDSLLSGLLAGAFGQAGIFELEEVELAEGRARIDRGEGSGLLIVPAGFGEALVHEDPTALTLVTNPAQRILPGMIEEMLSILVDGSFYLHRVLGEDLQTMIEGPDGDANLFPNQFVADLSVRINERVERMERFLIPPVITLDVVAPPVTQDTGPRPSFGTLFFPAMFFMALFFVAQGLSDDVWKERAQGTLRRVVTTPPQTGAFLLGKVIAGAAVIGLVGLVAASMAILMFGFEPGAVAVGLVWATLTGAVLLLVMMLVQLLAKTQRAGSLLSNVIVFPLLMLGGAFFPFEAMPDGMAAIGKLTPNGWALVEFKWLLTGELSAARFGRDLAMLFAVGGVLFWVCARRLRTRFAAEA